MYYIKHVYPALKCFLFIDNTKSKMQNKISITINSILVATQKHNLRPITL